MRNKPQSVTFQKRPTSCISSKWLKNSMQFTLGMPFLAVLGKFYRNLKGLKMIFSIFIFFTPSDSRFTNIVQTIHQWKYYLFIFQMMFMYQNMDPDWFWCPGSHILLYVFIILCTYVFFYIFFCYYSSCFSSFVIKVCLNLCLKMFTCICYYLLISFFLSRYFLMLCL